jgi:uncharacterized protein YuzE
MEIVMQINYDASADLLYLRLDDEPQEVVNRRVNDDIVLDIGAGDRIVGIEILDASKHVRMEKVFPVEYTTDNRRLRPLVVREKVKRAYRTRRG